MPGVVRVGLDSHIGHASFTPNPFHATKYVVGSPNVFVNGAAVVRVGDTTACSDPAAQGSPNVFVNNSAVHRLADATGGHGSWVPNAAKSASDNVFCNGGEGGGEPAPASAAIASKSACVKFDWNNNECLD